MRAKRIIFMGSFDPFHKGHLAIVSLLRNLEDIYGGGRNWLHIIPAYQNPNKPKHMFDYDERTVMIGRSVYNEEFGKSVEESNIIIDNIEEELAKETNANEPIYTINVLKRFCDKHPNDTIIWALTKETYAELKANKWYKSEECLSIPDEIEIVNTSHIPHVHSTDIRAMLFQVGDKQTFLAQNLHPNIIPIIQNKIQKQ